MDVEVTSQTASIESFRASEARTFAAGGEFFWSTNTALAKPKEQNVRFLLWSSRNQ